MIRLIKERKGITLISLVITMVITIILAGVTIDMVLGENSIIAKAKLASQMTQEEAKKEQEALKNIQKQLEAIGKEVSIGDYVAYTPQSENTTYTVEAKYSGYETDQTINQEALKWKVLSISNNTIDLISTTNTQESIYLNGSLGYNNGVYLLNDLCNSLYGNIEKEATARCIKVEDIQDNLDLTVWDYHTGETGAGTYGQTYTASVYADMYGGETRCPYLWTKEEDGELGESEQDELTLETYEEFYGEITQNTYWQILEENNFKDSRMYDLLYKDKNTWIASRSASNGTAAELKFGIKIITENEIGFTQLYRANIVIGVVSPIEAYTSYDEEGSNPVLPIVSIPLDAIDLSTGDGKSETTGWGIK